MKKFCAFLALVLSLVFAGATLAQDKPAATPDKPAAVMFFRRSCRTRSRR